MKPKLVLTGRTEPSVSTYKPWKRYPQGFIRLSWGDPLDGPDAGRWGIVIGQICYEYRVQYQTDTKAQ